jgi:hypothetical protein
VLIGETMLERASIRGRKLIAAAFIVIIASALLPLLRAGRGRSVSDLAMEFASTGAGRVLLAPVGVFGDILAAKQLAPDALPSVAIAALVLGALATVVVWLDAQYLESADLTGRKVHERIERLPRGGVIGFRPQPGARARCLRIPLPPRLNGVGPIAWRQLTTAVRQSRGVIVVLLLLCAALGPALYLAGVAEHPSPVTLIIGIVCSMNALFANALRFDFRGDLGHLDVLKSLPLRPAAIVVAQLVAPTLVLTICQIPLFAGLGFFFPVDAHFVLGAALTAIPLNALVFAIDNVLFLQFPARNWGVSPGDLHGVGRRMTISFAKTMILLAACGVAVNAGKRASVAVGTSSTVFIATTAFVLALETLALLPLMVRAFRRFDPSSETPF